MYGTPHRVDCVAIPNTIITLTSSGVMAGVFVSALAQTVLSHRA